MPTRKRQRRARLSRAAWALVDAAAWIVSVFAAAWIRYDLQIDRVLVADMVWLTGSAVLIHLLLGLAIGPYAVGHERGSFEETYDIGKTVAITGVILALAVLSTHLLSLPRSVPFTAPAFALLIMFTSRFVIRSWRVRKAAALGDEKRVVVFGAGEAGRRLTRSLIRDADSGYKPVAILDDDRSKGRLRLEGVRVRGSRRDLLRVADKYDAGTLIIALPLAEASTIRELTELATTAGLEVLTLPPVREIIGGRPTASDLRDVNVADLLGRRPVDLDMAVIAEQISGKRVLVTGAGGSIGSELCRQIRRFGPERLYLLDRDESGLQTTQMSLEGHGLLDSEEVILCDIRDEGAVGEVFHIAQPDIVFHAAALKHLPMLEAYPREGWKTNVLGTLNVLAAAASVGVGTFVNISTDKAANPSCVLGYSKRVAERLTADFAQGETGTYVSVRFGNVLGSRGSVVHAFTAQIERGGPITVTHPDVERYFMLIPEACQLVLEAASLGADGEVMVLDMGVPVRILEVAETLIRLSGRRDIDIVYTGLRRGEKMSEELFSDSEQMEATQHSMVSCVRVPGLGASSVRDLTFLDDTEAVQWMQMQSLGQQLVDARTGTE